MNNERWEDLIESTKEKYEVLEHKTEDTSFADDVGNSVPQETEIIIFNGPIGKTKLERTSRPVILDKKIHYAKTKGTGGQKEFVLSDTEKTHKVTAYKWNDDISDWEKVDGM